MIYSENEVVHYCDIEFTYDSDYHIKGKDKPLRIITSKAECPHIGMFCSVLELIGFEGLCCFNYKESNGVPLIIEINPRFGASLCSQFYSFIRKIA